MRLGLLGIFLFGLPDRERRSDPAQLGLQPQILILEFGRDCGHFGRGRIGLVEDRLLLGRLVELISMSP